jgi:hypothetical protein
VSKSPIGRAKGVATATLLRGAAYGRNGTQGLLRVALNPPKGPETGASQRISGKGDFRLFHGCKPIRDVSDWRAFSPKNSPVRITIWRLVSGCDAGLPILGLFVGLANHRAVALPWSSRARMRSVPPAFGNEYDIGLGDFSTMATSGSQLHSGARCRPNVGSISQLDVTFERQTRLPGRQDGALGRNGLAILHAMLFSARR